MLADAMTWGQLGVLAAVLAAVVGVAAYFSRQRVEVGPQPLRVQIDEALHDQFAGKGEFNTLKGHTTERHAQLFNDIRKAREEARAEVAKAKEEINADRAATMAGLRLDFDAIRKELTEQGREISGLQSSTDSQDKKLMSMDAKLDRLIERKS
jgi:capsule polysaccharide export protein KpsE/RkpR